MIEKFKLGMALGRAHYAKIASKGERWKRRNMPIYIRSELFVPYYIIEDQDEFVLHIIQFPITGSDKVQFIEFARSRIDENST